LHLQFPPKKLRTIKPFLFNTADERFTHSFHWSPVFAAGRKTVWPLASNQFLSRSKALRPLLTLWPNHLSRRPTSRNRRPQHARCNPETL
jgi:hypothetical protein